MCVCVYRWVVPREGGEYIGGRVFGTKMSLKAVPVKQGQQVYIKKGKVGGEEGVQQSVLVNMYRA